MLKFLSLLIGVFASTMLTAQLVPNNWYQEGPTDKYSGIGIDKLYQSIGSEKEGQPVVVAVIDSGVDIDHEDLDDVIWNNPGEIPDNGKDDDNNGYVDDIHGWNFIGGADGTNIIQETYEVTRLYGKYRDYFKDKDPDKLSGKDKEKYALYQEVKSQVETERKKAQKNLDKFEETEELIAGGLKAMEKEFGDQEIALSDVEEFEAEDQNSLIGKEIFKNIIEETGESISVDGARELVDEEFASAKEQFLSKLNYGYNPDFNSREIIGDDYSNQYERYYGNNDVHGEFSFHGTHVSGIIAAERDNDLGVKGVSNNARIMVIRAVPDGDEHDKDVANAIRYAVDNGASVVNMSFGKGYAWNKKVVDDAVKYAAKNDVLLVHAAGNSAQNNDSSNNFPNDEYEKRGFFGPKTARNWIEVGALNFTKDENAIASFSNYGKDQVDLFAPGVFIYSTAPGSEYQIAQGTSMASPVVAGVAAMIRSYFPALTAEQVKDILMKSVTPINQKVIKPGTYDRVPASELAVSAGVINAYEAYQLAKKTKGKKKVKSSGSGSNSAS